MWVYNGQKDLEFVPTTHTLKVASCGVMSSVKTGDCTVYRLNGRQDWSLFYVKQGFLYIDGQKLSTGDLYIYPPRITQKYTVYFNDDTLYNYVHFTGENVEKLFLDLLLDTQKIYNVEHNIVSPFLERLLTVSVSSDQINKLKAEYNLMGLILVLAEKFQAKSDVSMASIISTMHSDLKRPFDANYYAKMLNLSVSRFNHVFKKETGYSPLNYYINLRMETAKSMLKFTNMRICKIAENLGYDDVLYFSKVFKKHLGVSPSKFRQKDKETIT